MITLNFHRFREAEHHVRGCTAWYSIFWLIFERECSRCPLSRLGACIDEDSSVYFCELSAFTPRPQAVTPMRCPFFPCWCLVSSQASCSCSRHPDLTGCPLSLAAPERFGFGSVHHLRDLGDTLKLLQAMNRVEADGQVSGCVVVVTV